MDVADTTVNEEAIAPPKLTAVALDKFKPVIVTVSPLPVATGVNEVIAGGDTNIKPLCKAVPPGVVTDTFPEAPLLTTAVIVVAFTTAKEDALTPPKLTAVAPEKFVPLIVTVAPTPEVKGMKELITGGGINTNPESAPVPPGVVTATSPDEPPEMIAVIVVEFTTVNEPAGVPPNLTEVVPLKLAPVIVTAAPLAAKVGLNDAITGGGI